MRNNPLLGKPQVVANGDTHFIQSIIDRCRLGQLESDPLNFLDYLESAPPEDFSEVFPVFLNDHFSGIVYQHVLTMICLRSAEYYVTTHSQIDHSESMLVKRCLKILNEEFNATNSVSKARFREICDQIGDLYHVGCSKYELQDDIRDLALSATSVAFAKNPAKDSKICFIYLAQIIERLPESFPSFLEHLVSATKLYLLNTDHSKLPARDWYYG